MAAQAAYSVAGCLLSFSGPFFLQRIIRAIEAAGSDSGHAAAAIRGAYLDAACMLVCTVAQSALAGQAMWIGRRISIRLKGLLVAELSAKTLRRRGKGAWEDARDKEEAEPNDEDEANDEDGDEDDAAQAAADGKIMNLLTADFQRVAEVVAYLDELYAMPLALAVAVWYMYRLLGAAALLGLGASVVYVPLSKALFQHVARLEERINVLSDERVAAITELLQGIRAVKLLGWESRFVARIDERRERQLACLWRMLQSWAWVSVVTQLSPMLVLFAILGLYVVAFGNALTAEVAFTTISVFQMVRTVFEHMPGFLTWAIGGYVSLGRIDSFLAQPEVQPLEDRVPGPAASSACACAALGFADADLSWDGDGDGDGDAAGRDQGPTAVGTPALAKPPTEPTPTEQTPLLSASAADGRHTPLSAQTMAAAADGRAPFALRGIDVQFPPGALSLVAGPTGAGKSSLLAALVGEMTLTRGRVLVPTEARVARLAGAGLAVRDVAYVAQEPWLRNATIRANVLFGERYDRERYEAVLRMCALKPDLRALAAGDQTEIGERGVTLSGGQKQRVALARAVYSSRRILLIDDCLSAVDAHTARHILRECLAAPAPLMRGRTRVLATHHVAMCLPLCQFVVLLRDGAVALKGPPAQLQAHAALADVLAGPGGQDASGDRTPDEPAAADDALTEDQHNAERLRRIADARGGDASAAMLDGALVEEEERASGFVKPDVWLAYLRACGGGWFWAAAVVGLGAVQAMWVMQDYWVRIWVSSTGSPDIAPPAYVPVLLARGAAHLVPAHYLVPSPHAQASQQQQQHQQQHSAVYWLGIYMAIGVATIACDAAKLLYIYAAAVRASRSLHRRLLRAVAHATPRFFDTTPLGRIVSRFSRDMQTVDEETMETLTFGVADSLSVASAVVIITSATPAFAVVAAAIALAYAAIARYYLATSRELKRLEANSMSPLLSLFGELILGVSTIRAFGAGHLYVREALDRIDAHNRPYYMVWAAARWLSVRIDAAGALVSFSCALFLLANVHRIDAGLAGFTLSYALSFSWSMLWLVRNYSDNELNMNAVERIGQYTHVDQEAPLHVAGLSLPPEWPATGALAVENLVVEYVPGAPVLRGLSLDVRAGERIGVVGRTGAGKSTLALALLRFAEPAAGRVLLDGVDIARVGLEDLRRRVTIIPQDPVLFNGTIRFNLDPLAEHPDELVWDALRRTHLARGESRPASVMAAATDGAEDAAEGAAMRAVFDSLDAEIKENGQSLSLGQRQLVALARALVRRSRLIVMDEATASVDFDTDARIQRTIRGPEFARSTIVCIAHRLRTVIDYDRVLVLDHGAMVEFDSPAALLQKKDGVFRAMCEESGDYARLAALACASEPET